MLSPTAAHVPDISELYDTETVHFRLICTGDVYELHNLPKVKSAIDRLKLANKPGCKTIVIMPGDFLAPSTISCVDHGTLLIFEYPKHAVMCRSYYGNVYEPN